MLVSIIITNYNYGNYLHRCIRSCLNQSLSTNEFEVILVDDLSSDNSANIIDEYKTLPNFRVIHNKKNLGVAASSNNAFRKAKGKFIVRVDSDDFVTKEFASILSYYLIENPKMLGVACDYYLINELGEKLKKVSCKNNPISCGIMYNKNKLLRIGLYNPKFKHREEEELRSRLDEAYKIHHISLPMYRYRIHKTNKTKSNDYINIFKKKIDKLKKKNFLKKYNKNKILNNVIVIIPARGGSKRLKNKNIFPFKGKPMIYWSIKAAKESFFANDIYVTSENQKILSISKMFGAKVIERPRNLSKSNIFKIEALRHANDYIEKQRNKTNSLIISLQANSPEICADDINKSVMHLIKFNRQEVISIDNNNNSNAAIRVMKRNALYQKSLSTYLGCVCVKATDIHTIGDIKKILSKDEN